MKLLTSIALMLFTVVAYGQDRPLANDENGKLIYYEVQELKSVPKDSLMARAEGFLRSAKTLKVSVSKTDSLIQASGKMIINKTALVLSRPSGEVLYRFNAETRDGKYRFWLTDFEFIPYQRDRYGNFVPATSIGIPLERKPGKLNAAEWASYIKAITKEANILAAKFKDAMANKAITQPPVAKAVPVISTKKW
ncbi:DUF4468 domain-containing protein [Pedobacter africanus]|nr:DUF4468 domain-containing protein [Pedobacter africanus]